MDENIVYFVLLIIIIVAIIISIIIFRPTQNNITGEKVTCTCIGNKGRLGNQLFQLAAVMGISNENNFEPILYKDIFNTQLGQILDLSKFNTNHYTHPALRITIKEGKYSVYSKTPLEKNMYTYDIDGYYQSYLYFKDIEDKIHDTFKIKRELIDKIIKRYPSCKFQNSIGIHIRRGDYVSQENLKTYTQCNAEYYYTALQKITDKLKNEKYNIIICSDDINWCKQNLNIKDSIYSNNLSWDEDFTLLSQCQHQIIANSTFSWWAAYLKDRSMIHHIVAPTPWFKADGQFGHMNSPEIYYPTWDVIKVNN